MSVDCDAVVAVPHEEAVGRDVGAAEEVEAIAPSLTAERLDVTECDV